MNQDIPRDWDKQRIAEDASFLQSSAWAEFQNSLGFKIHLLEGRGWSCLLIERRNRLGRYLFAPYGPTLSDAKSLPDCLQELKSFARAQSVHWLKLEPVAEQTEPALLATQLKKNGFRPADHDVDPHLTRILDLKPSEDEILAGISQSTRSLIRKNSRENTLTFRTSDDPADIRLFLEMLHQVVQRNQIYFFNDDYFVKQAGVLMPKGMMHLELAYHGDVPVAAAIMQDFGETSAFAFAASKAEARQLNGSALLLWQSLLNAKSRGCGKMDLFGIAPDDAPPSHPWFGFSAYKRKFGGEVIERSGTWDLPLSQRYGLYRKAQAANKRIRRLRR
jgi:lipid II:glycine glycyltransferase (peptidoglycan interpeptide bridge formation enzyme)